MPKRFPFTPFPDGWFVACFSRELPRGAVLAKTLLGREVVIFRTESGVPAVLDAYCPHMGAHLGHGGRTVGESIRCPMHGFRFDRTGTCVATGYDTRLPPRCRSEAALPVLEMDGIVLVFHDHAGRPPGWRPTRHGLDQGGRLFTHVLRGLRSHPQETTENSVDIGHFAVVHGYEGVRLLEPLSLDGPRLTMRYAMERRRLLPGTPRVRAEFAIEVCGLGVSHVDVDVPSHGVRAKQLVASSPLDGETVDLHLATVVEGEAPWLRRVPRVLIDHTLGLGVFLGVLHDVRQDIAVWTNKAYMHPPALAKGDGPIGQYRRWATQFYPPRDAGHEESAVVAAAPKAST